MEEGNGEMKMSKITTGQSGWNKNLNKFQGRIRFTSQYNSNENSKAYGCKVRPPETITAWTF